jgi:NADPH2:quinone reductase
LPSHTTFEEGACLGIPALTAHRALFADGPLGGKTVLVTGGAGTVGFYAIQLAKWAGARVIATVSSAEKGAVASRAGADLVIDYRRQDVVALVKAATDGALVDRVVDVDFAANVATTMQIVKAHGHLVSYASFSGQEPAIPFYPLMVKNAILRFVFVYEMPPEALEQACREFTAWLGSGRAVHQICGTFTPSRVADAHELVDGGSRIGSVLVDMR